MLFLSSLEKLRCPLYVTADSGQGRYTSSDYGTQFARRIWNLHSHERGSLYCRIGSVHIEKVHVRQTTYNAKALFTGLTIMSMVTMPSHCCVWPMPTSGATTVKGTYRHFHSPALLLRCFLQNLLPALWMQGRDLPPCLLAARLPS